MHFLLPTGCFFMIVELVRWLKADNKFNNHQKIYYH